MAIHRFPELISTTTAAPADGAGFVPCPSALLATLSAEQRTAIAAVYRLARQCLDGQEVASSTPWQRRCQFSRN